MKIFNKVSIVIGAFLFASQIFGAQVQNNIIFFWINNLHEIELIVNNPESFNYQNIELQETGFPGKSYKLNLLKKTNDSLVFKTSEELSLKKNYIIHNSNQHRYGYYTLDFVATHFNYDGPLGIDLETNKKKATFKLWSPTADKVTLVITSPIDKKILFTYDLVRKDQGVWEIILNEKINLDGLHYQYKIKAYGKEFVALDPYAKSMASFNPLGTDRVGTGTIISTPVNLPYTPSRRYKDDAHFIGMEVHVRDATISPNSPAKDVLKGTYLGFIDALDSYKNLGVTHLQLLPLQNFYTVNENQKSYQGPEVPRSEINYNWGYDPQNFFTPEGWYSSDARNPYARITELQKMTREIHQRKMGVILDVVYNHVYSGAAFEASAPGLYLRRNRNGEVSSGTGAGETLESRSVMVRRLIVDSLVYWQNVYHIDGFRFDLMGFLDKETMKAIRSSLHPETILYGEAWVFTDLPMHEAVVKTDLPHDLNLSAFNDTTRDSYAGRNEGKGFVQGNFFDNQRVRAGIIGGIKNHPQWDLISQDAYNVFAESPMETLNYLTIHDGFTLWDKINLSVGGDKNSRMQIAKNAYAMLFTSQGRIILQQGCEAGRSKPLYGNDPYPDRAHTSSVVTAENGIRYFHENTYSSSDATNRFDWERALEFEELRNYIKGFIEIRKRLPGLRLLEANSIKKGLRFLPQTGDGLISYLINNEIEEPDSEFEKILVIHNGYNFSQNVRLEEISNPQEWKILSDCQRASIKPIHSLSVNVFQGGVSINGKCSSIIVKSKR